VRRRRIAPGGWGEGGGKQYKKKTEDVKENKGVEGW